jgi:hypothetical protein
MGSRAITTEATAAMPMTIWSASRLGSSQVSTKYSVE